MKRKILWLFSLSLVFASMTIKAQTVDREKEAVTTAEAWLALVDAGS